MLKTEISEAAITNKSEKTFPASLFLISASQIFLLTLRAGQFADTFCFRESTGL
jgi:hypothetical protein